MAHIDIIPYEPIKNQTFSESQTIDLKAAIFENIEYKEGRSVIFFHDCDFFGELEIVNDDEIPFKDVSLYFHGCYISRISINKITSLNISVGFGSSIISGKIESSNLLHVSMIHAKIARY